MIINQGEASTAALALAALPAVDTAGDLLYATGSTTLTKLPIGVAGRVLKSTGTAPDWQLNPTYLPVVLHNASTVQISVASGYLPVLLHDGITTVNVALF